MENSPKEIDCKRAGAALNRLLPVCFEYARRKRLDLRPFSRYADFEDLWERCPENWEENVLGMLAGGAVFCRPKTAAAFARSAGPELRQDELRLARLWRSVPWIYCFFEPLEADEGSFVRVRPLGARPAWWPDDRGWDELLIYSPSVASQARGGYRLVFAQLCCIGEAFLTYGATIPFTGFELDDPYFLADIASGGQTPGGRDLRGHTSSWGHPSDARAPRRTSHGHTGDIGNALLGVVGRSANICDVISADPVPFIGLFLFSETPAVTTRAGKPGRFASCVERDDMSTDEAQWRQWAEANGESISRVVRIGDALGIYLGDGSPMYDPAIFVATADRRLYLSAMNLNAYERGQRVLSGNFDIPEVPQSRATMAAFLAARELFGLDDRLSELQEAFDDRREELGPNTVTGEDWDEAADGTAGETAHLPTVEQANEIFNRLTHNHNEGIHESDDEIAAELDVDASIVAGLREKIEGMITGMGHGGRDSSGTPGATPAHGNGTDLSGAAAANGRRAGPELSQRYGLPPRAIHELIRPALPIVRGALVVREASEMTRRAERTGVDPRALFEAAPAHRFATWMLGLATERGGVPTTQAGYVATDVIRRAYEQHIVPTPADLFREIGTEDPEIREDLVEELRPRKEADWIRFHALRMLLERVGLLRFDGRKFVADEAVPELLTDPALLYRTLLEAMFSTVEWDHHRRLGSLPRLRESAGFLYYVAGVLSEEADAEGWIPMERLGEAFCTANPPVRDAAEETFGEEAMDMVQSMIDSLFVHGFAGSFGLFEARGYSRSNSFFRTTELYRVVFDNAALKW